MLFPTSPTHLVFSRSCLFLPYLFNRSVVSSLQFLFILSSFLLFSSEVQSKFCHSCSLVISLYRCGHILLVFVALISMSFNLQGSRNVPCSSLLTECLQSRSSPLYSFFQFVQPLKVHGFTRLSKKQLCFTSSSSAFLRCHPRSRDEISCKWRSVVTPQDRRSRCLPCFACQLCYLFVCCIHHRIIRIASALHCRHVFKTCTRPYLSCPPLLSLSVPRPTLFFVFPLA